MIRYGLMQVHPHSPAKNCGQFDPLLGERLLLFDRSHLTCHCFAPLKVCSKKPWLGLGALPALTASASKTALVHKDLLPVSIRYHVV